MQQDRRAVHRGKSDGRDANLKAMTGPITWLKAEGMRQIGPFGWFVLTALMKRLSVAAGKISFSRVTFLQLENNNCLSGAGYSFGTSSSQSCRHNSAEVERVFNRTLEEENLSGSPTSATNAWCLSRDSHVTLPRQSVQLKPQMSTCARIKPFVKLRVHLNY